MPLHHPKKNAAMQALKDLLHRSQSQYTCPPWLRYPGTSKDHVFWRMGEGDYYRFKWEEWIVTLDNADRAVYKEAFPPPPSWNEPPYSYYDCVEGTGSASDPPGTAAIVASRLDRTLWTVDGLPPRGVDGTVCDLALPPIHFTNNMVCEDRNAPVTQSCLSTRFYWIPPDGADFVEQFHEGAHRLTDIFGSVQDYVVVRAQELRAENLCLADIGDDVLTSRVFLGPGQLTSLASLEEAVVATLDGEEWAGLYFSILAEANFLKFSQNKSLRQYLDRVTGNAPLLWTANSDPLEPGVATRLAANTWGDDSERMHNLFGNALMAARASIRHVFAFEDVFDSENVC